MSNTQKAYEVLLAENQSLKNQLNEYEAKLDKINNQLQSLSLNSVAADTNDFGKKYYQVISNLPVPAYLIDTKGSFIGCNSSFEKFVNKTSYNILGKTPSQIFPKEIEDRTIYSNQEEQASLDFTSHDIVNIIKDKEIKTLIISESVYKSHENKPLGILGVFNDITEKTKAEKKLRESELKTRELNDIKDQFFHIVSHDLKSPFSALLGFTQLLVDDYKDLDDEDKLTFIEQIHSTANFSFRLLNNLQLWSKISLDKMPLYKEVIDPKLIIDQCAAIFSDDIKSKNISIQIISKDNFEIIVDPKILEIITENLISNAVKFVGDNGIIKIELKEVQDEIIINFIDNGIGLSEEDLKKLFKIEVHTIQIGTQKSKGTGLGLVLCKLLTELNDGIISIESELGEGTTVQLKFPKIKNA